MTKQPSSGTALLAPQGDGPRKGDLNKSHLLFHPVGWPRSTGIFPSGRKTTRNSGSAPAPNDATGLKLPCWNISRRNIDIAALSEVRFPDTGSLKEQGAGYTLYWSDKPHGERRLSGVGFMIKNNIAAKMENLPTGHSDRIISMRLSLRKEQYVTLFTVYAPTLQEDPADRDNFYADLRNLVQNTPTDDKVVILGDFNASGPRFRSLERSSRETWRWELQRQRAALARTLRRIAADNHQHPLPADRQCQDNLDASSVETLAPHRFCPSAPATPQRRLPHKSDAQRRMSHIPPSCTMQTQPALQTQTETRRSPKEETSGEQPTIS